MDKDGIKQHSTISGGCVKQEQGTKTFVELNSLLTQDQAFLESDRCYFCYDAPCIEACPTEIMLIAFTPTPFITEYDYQTCIEKYFEGRIDGNGR